LSILYAGALQAVGVETAFITIPGHLYGAFALKAPPDQAQRLFSDPSQLIIHDGRAWVPIEFTLVNGSFLEAWQVGAQQWRTHEPTGDAVIYPLYEAWKDYEPVGQGGDYDSAEFLDSDQIAPLFAAELDRFIEREIFAQTERLQRRVDAGRADAAIYNRLGAVYARYGRLDQARDYFLEASRDRSHAPSLMNLANLAMLEGELSQAIVHLERAESISPRDPYVKIQLARVQSRRGDFGRSAEYYRAVEEAAPEPAAQFAHLDVNASAATRASGRQAMEEVMLWIDDSAPNRH
jgi:tetratricopeptide (TPR) repeat protein